LSRVQPGMQTCHQRTRDTEQLTTYQDRTFR
jgi:hypothetical protein